MFWVYRKEKAYRCFRLTAVRLDEEQEETFTGEKALLVSDMSFLECVSTQIRFAKMPKPQSKERDINTPKVFGSGFKVYVFEVHVQLEYKP